MYCLFSDGSGIYLICGKVLPHREYDPYSLQKTLYVLVLLLREEISISCENHTTTCKEVYAFLVWWSVWFVDMRKCMICWYDEVYDLLMWWSVWFVDMRKCMICWYDEVYDLLIWWSVWFVDMMKCMICWYEEVYDLLIWGSVWFVDVTQNSTLHLWIYAVGIFEIWALLRHCAA
jgi:hypothetical protein